MSNEAKKRSRRTYIYSKDPNATRVLLNLDGDTSNWLLEQAQKNKQAVSQVIREILWLFKDMEAETNAKN